MECPGIGWARIVPLVYGIPLHPACAAHKSIPGWKPEDCPLCNGTDEYAGGGDEE